MATQTDISVEQEQIRRLIANWENAAREKDIDALMAFYAPDVVAFDVIPPLRFVGEEDYRKDWEMGFSMCQGETESEMRDLNITAGPDVAFCHWLNRMSGTSNEGEHFDCWVRWTQCWRKTNGAWQITHEHISVPVDMEGNKALMNLTP